ncbi:hypothetical protein BDN71DRAFT_1500362 [Pleurotus eryngii]|uniref:Uncharacterized protein n=1 Tax=Pleurotus eryngii TaxID=5323 RepID=A0A9P6ACJ6_PLEER|nr:hypothetical protein BDN71DRAFT_1500362 [Pleurotus eryngii]
MTQVDEAMMQMTSLCGDIIAARDDIQRTMAALGSEAEVDEVPEPEPIVETPDVDIDKPGKLAVGEDNGRSSLEYSSFNFNAALSSSSNGIRIPKDRMHLVKELAVMATSLPPGIWDYNLYLI